MPNKDPKKRTQAVTRCRQNARLKLIAGAFPGLSLQGFSIFKAICSAAHFWALVAILVI